MKRRASHDARPWHRFVEILLCRPYINIPPPRARFLLRCLYSCPMLRLLIALFPRHYLYVFLDGAGRERARLLRGYTTLQTLSCREEKRRFSPPPSRERLRSDTSLERGGNNVKIISSAEGKNCSLEEREYSEDNLRYIYIYIRSIYL